MSKPIPLFEFDGRSIYVPAAELFLDTRKRCPHGFVSHAHGDHIAKHDITLCTPQTADLLKLRIRDARCLTIPYQQKTIWKNTHISLYPAGHILGSAQLLIEVNGISLLYTGDFKTSRSHTVQPFVPVQADILIMETTFGSARYRFPPREDIEKDLIQLVGEKLNQNVIPVIYAYSLGKAQEALYLLSQAGFTVAVERKVLRFCRIYEKYGVKFGAYEKLDKDSIKGKVLLLPAHQRSDLRMSHFGKSYSIYLSGWGISRNAHQRFRVDHVIPLSDHSDYEELLQFVQVVNPQRVFCTHGFEEIVREINHLGIQASYLRERDPVTFTL